VISAHAMATVAAMFPGRLPWVALGSGEALNEHVTGDPWPSKPERMERLRECVEVMRALWRGEEVSHRGHVVVDRARLGSLPDRPPRLVAGAMSVKTAAWAVQWADGLITTNQPGVRFWTYALSALATGAPDLTGRFVTSTSRTTFHRHGFRENRDITGRLFPVHRGGRHS